jgi:hypothetical protein
MVIRGGVEPRGLLDVLRGLHTDSAAMRKPLKSKSFLLLCALQFSHFKVKEQFGEPSKEFFIFGQAFILKCIEMQSIANWEPQEQDLLNKALFQCALNTDSWRLASQASQNI